MFIFQGPHDIQLETGKLPHIQVISKIKSSDEWHSDLRHSALKTEIVIEADRKYCLHVIKAVINIMIMMIVIIMIIIMIMIIIIVIIIIIIIISKRDPIYSFKNNPNEKREATIDRVISLQSVSVSLKPRQANRVVNIYSLNVYMYPDRLPQTNLRSGWAPHPF